MKKYNFLIAAITVFMIPGVFFGFLTRKADKVLDIIERTETAAESVPDEPAETCQVRVKTEDGILLMELDAYVSCVLAGEMPAEFHEEAKKAQATAIRTYTLHRLNRSKHTDADVCTDAACCQAFVMADEVSEPVKLTSGEVITYNAELIDATYFSCSGGSTEDAVEVWGTDVPYLQAKQSPGEETSDRYVSSLKMNTSEFAGCLGLDTAQSIKLGSVSYTAGGGVKCIEICGKEYTGVEVRRMLSLPSTAFKIQVVDQSVIITSKGNGHRVGMSQYGAEAMAVSGSTYQEILAYYYTGTEIRHLTEEELQGVFDKASGF